ncbi:uncharacterized protein LOC114362118 [Ostrinia furnacalis]|uniref:uncharacterized protein LOC114362118 n=1 Tax=Ostrinia furnacalis TaxID=93504 RepID=UPI00103B4B66|nr:uncharacterized protein LOC114362118 [Ostrinia furnacalis]
MTTLNSTFGHCEDSVNPMQSGDMSIDGPSIDKESPPRYVTFRKGMANSDVLELRNDFQTFQTTMLNMLESWFNKQDEKLAKFMKDFENIKTSIKYMNDSFEEIKSKTEDVAKRVSELEKHSANSNDSLRLLQLEDKIDAMEQQARMCNVEISNLPEKRGEDLPAILENLAAHIKMPLNKQDIVSIHRVPQATAGSTRPKNIIVKLTSRLLRDNFIAAVRLNKGIDSPQLGISGTPYKIYVNEHLTLKKKNLFRETRETARKHGFRFVWVKHGTILVRASETTPIIAIRSDKDLSKMEHKK